MDVWMSKGGWTGEERRGEGAGGVDGWAGRRGRRRWGVVGGGFGVGFGGGGGGVACVCAWEEVRVGGWREGWVRGGRWWAVT